MTIKIVAYGIAKDILGNHEFFLETAEEITVGELLKQLKLQFPGFQKLQSLAIAVNASFAEDEIVIQADDEVVLIPPVSGG